MSAFDMPSAMAFAVCSSRAVRWASCRRADWRAVLRESAEWGPVAAAITRDVAAESTGLLSATDRIAPRRSGGGVSLRTKPSAPIRKAPSTASSESNVVSTSTRGGAGWARITSVALSPSRPGC